MQVLQELVRLYVLYSKNRFDLFQGEKVGAQATRMRKLFEGISSGVITSDANAKTELYGSISKVPASTYNSIKMRLLRRLIDSVSFLDPKRAFVNPRTIARQECIQNVAALKVLLLYRSTQTTKYLAEKTYRLAKQYELTTAAKECLTILAHIEAYAGRQKSYEKYATELLRLIEVQSVEDTSTLYVERVSSWYAANWSLRSDKHKEIARYVKELEEYWLKYRTATLHENYVLLSKILAEAEQDYDRILWLTNELKRYYTGKPVVRNGLFYSQFVISSMAANIWMGRYDAAYHLAKEFESLVPKGRIAWFVFQESYLILALRTKNYTLARNIFLEVITHPSFRRDDPLMLEKWRLLEFYIRFVSSDQIRVSLLPAEQLKSKSKYRHFRAFASTFSVLAKDLQGFNVVAVFAQILFLLRVRDYDSLIQRDESLQTLRRKRLNKLNYRLAIFAQLIHVMVEQEFDAARIQKSAAVWLRKLKNVPPKFKGGTAETLEIIPLEDLWEMMMEELKGGPKAFA